MPEMTMLPTKVDWSDIDQQKRIVGYVKDRLDAARTRADPFKRSALIDFQNFCQVSSVFGYNHHMVEPMTLESVNSTEESVMANVFGKERFFDLRALDGQNAVKVEKNRERLLRALRSAKWKMKYFKWADDAVKFGRGEMLTVACPWWDRRQTDEPMSDGQGFDLTLGRQRSQTNAIRVRPEFVNVSFWNQLPYPYEGYPDVQDAPYHACWIDYPLATIRAMKFQPWAMVVRGVSDGSFTYLVMPMNK